MGQNSYSSLKPFFFRKKAVTVSQLSLLKCLAPAGQPASPQIPIWPVLRMSLEFSHGRKLVLKIRQ